MINLRVANNVESKNIIVSDDTTARQAFEQAGIRVGSGMVSVDGRMIRELDTPLSHFVTGTEATLMAIVKNDNARA